MELTKINIKKTLENVNISGSSENIVASGILKNIQVFGDQVDIDLILSNPTLQARKKLEVDIMKIIHTDIYEKAKININVKINIVHYFNDNIDFFNNYINKINKYFI